MDVFVNDSKVTLFQPLTSVRHALLAAGLFDEVASGKKVYDEWGNELGLDGALNAGARIYLRQPPVR